MGLLLAPPDELVELKLGPVVKSWSPLPLDEVNKVALGHTSNLRMYFLLAVSFILAVVIAGLVGKMTGNTIAVVVSGIGTLAVMFLGMMKLENAIHNSKRIGIFERGMRFGKSIVPFDDLKVITFGAPKTFSEKHLPTLSDVQRVSARGDYETDELIKNAKTLSLTIFLANNKRIVWFAFSAIAGKDTVHEFFPVLDELIPVQLRGLALTQEERRQIEDV